MKLNKGIILLIVMSMVGGCATRHNPKIEETKLYKIWSHVYIAELGKAIQNTDNGAFRFYTEEYSTALDEEVARLNVIFPKNDKLPHGDVLNVNYVWMSDNMKTKNFEAALFYWVSYCEDMQNRFLYNSDFKPIPDYAK
jgi:hypothetical protein